jgi:hypothetical protein
VIKARHCIYRRRERRCPSGRETRTDIERLINAVSRRSRPHADTGRVFDTVRHQAAIVTNAGAVQSASAERAKGDKSEDPAGGQRGPPTRQPWG